MISHVPCWKSEINRNVAWYSGIFKWKFKFKFKNAFRKCQNLIFDTFRLCSFFCQAKLKNSASYKVKGLIKTTIPPTFYNIAFHWEWRIENTEKIRVKDKQDSWSSLICQLYYKNKIFFFPVKICITIHIRASNWAHYWNKK